MPIHEYRCRDCGHVTEVLALTSQPDRELSCDHCRSRSLDKMISSPATVGIVSSSLKGKTCCGKDERCEAPPCFSGGICRRD
jgi:putative FmdB family regulatory protein